MLLASCATTPKIDWAGRIGSYTYDQAVLEMGPPDRCAKLTDGTVVAEWLTRRGYVRTSPSFGVGYGYWLWPHYASYYESYWPDYFLRLTFDADGKLKDWKKVAR